MNLRLFVQAYPVSENDVRQEFEHFIEKANREQWNELEVVFSLTWNPLPRDYEYYTAILSPDELAARLSSAERKGDGKLGHDDFWVTPLANGIEHHFCHEGDLHLEGPVDSEYILSEAARYKAAGWSVHHRIVNTDIKYTDSRDKPPWEKL